MDIGGDQRLRARGTKATEYQRSEGDSEERCACEKVAHSFCDKLRHPSGLKRGVLNRSATAPLLNGPIPGLSAASPVVGTLSSEVFGYRVRHGKGFSYCEEAGPAEQVQDRKREGRDAGTDRALTVRREQRAMRSRDRLSSGLRICEGARLHGADAELD